jgi:hypothetical protein
MRRPLGAYAGPAEHDDSRSHSPSAQAFFNFLVLELEADAPHRVAEKKIAIKLSQSVRDRPPLNFVRWGRIFRRHFVHAQEPAFTPLQAAPKQP